jgi:tetratricopeptide (TPR) repeat protein
MEKASRQRPGTIRSPLKLIAAAIVIASILPVLGASDEASRETVIRIVSKIQRADYEGNQAGMQKAHDELTPFLENKVLAPRARYWRGFAQWRRAINGFNDAVDPKELEEDLNHALDEFKAVKEKEPGFDEARIGMVSCLGLIGYIHQKDTARVQELMGQLVPLSKELKVTAPDNPRLLWVRGPNVFISPPERGGGQEKAIELYQQGLELCRKNKPSHDRLEPSWCEPELLMNLAYSYTYKDKPDFDAAESHAQAALKIVPYWHYVRDILMPQIVAGKAKQKGD